MTKTMRIKIICFILALFVAVFATGTVFAWFSNQQWDMEITGNTIGAYFAYGSGKKNDPFGITHSQHMYNLAWLQNRGFFNTDKNQEIYYFELGANVVDMRESGKTVIIPPIGNNEFPFKGEFEGHGHVISNLIVSTNRDELDYTYRDAEFANAVGLFGMTDEASVIKNFILDYPTVEAANENDVSSSYTDPENNPYDTDDTLAAGLAVGYVAGKVQSIGVLGGTLAVRRQNYTTFNSILGSLSEDALGNNNVTGSGPGTGGGENTGDTFGATFDVEGIYDRLDKIAANNGASWRLPKIATSDNGYITLTKMEKLPFTVTDASTYSGANAYEVVADENIGYLVGNKNEAFSKEFTFGPKLADYAAGTTPGSTGTIPSWIYKQSVTWASESQYDALSPILETDYYNLPPDILAMIPDEAKPVY